MATASLSVISFPAIRPLKLSHGQGLQGGSMNIRKMVSFDTRGEETVNTSHAQDGLTDSDQRDLALPSTREVKFSNRLTRAGSFDGRNMKGSALPLPLPTPILSTHTKRPGRDTTKGTKPSVFERLSNTETIASIHRKLLLKHSPSRQAIQQRSTSAPPLRIAVTNKKNEFKKNNDNFKLVSKASFDRLAGTHTELSKIRRRKPALEDEHKGNRKTFCKGSVPRRRTGTPKGKRISRLERWKSASNNALFDAERNEYIEEKRNELELEDDFGLDDHLGPPLEIECILQNKVFCTNSYNPEDDGYEEIDTQELGIEECLVAYEAGESSAKDLASTTIKSLFLQDLQNLPAIEWDVGSTFEKELGMPLGEWGYSFFIQASEKKPVEENEAKDDSTKNLECCASASGNVIFIHDLAEIHVENYNFVHEKEC